ncbi:hypothetical protein NQL31_001559 [Lotmaria passim]
MSVLHLLLVFLVDDTALQYALCVACVLAPLYAFVLKPAVRSARSDHRTMALTTAAAAPIRDDSPARPSAASSRSFLSPTSVGATPMQVTPVFHSQSEARAARVSGGRGSGGAVSPSLEAVGTPARSAGKQVEYRSPTKRPTSQLPQQNYLALRLLRRQQRHALYNELDITEASLEALYASPKFQAWYGANREELLRDVQLRESFYQWRSFARAAVLLVALTLLPAFSFSTETNALQWRKPLASDGSTAVASAPFTQILLTRVRFIQNERSAEAVAAQARALPFVSHMRADVRLFAASMVNTAEWVAIVAAVCSLVTSCFMPRGSRRTASIAFAAFLVVLVESALIPGVSVRLGLGTLIIVVVVGTKIRRAAE